MFGFVAAKKAEHSIQMMCRVLGVSRSGFHAWAAREPSERALADRRLTEQIVAIHAANRRVYGSPRIHAELRLEHDIRVGRKRAPNRWAVAATDSITRSPRASSRRSRRN